MGVNDNLQKIENKVLSTMVSARSKNGIRKFYFDNHEGKTCAALILQQ